MLPVRYQAIGWDPRVGGRVLLWSIKQPWSLGVGSGLKYCKYVTGASGNGQGLRNLASFPSTLLDSFCRQFEEIFMKSFASPSTPNKLQRLYPMMRDA